MNKKEFVLAANWKMNPVTLKEAERMLDGVETGVARLGRQDCGTSLNVIVFPPAVYLGALEKRKTIPFGIQNIGWEWKGAYTGEISYPMAENVGCKYAIIGHSERRRMFGETDETVNLKLRSLLQGSLKPIVCIGETKEEKDEGLTAKVLKEQIRTAFEKVSVLALPKIMIAYEPVWAISGMEKSAKSEADSPDNVMSAAILIRKTLFEIYRSDVVSKVKILYGGSVNGKNVDGFIALDALDGLLIGGASLNVFEFLTVARKAYEGCQITLEKIIHQ